MDTTRCVVCKRTYTPSSKPQWAANADGVIVGTAHAGCAPWSREGHIRRAFGIDTPIEAARFTAWHNAHYRPQSQDTNFYASILLGPEPPQDTPSERQTRLLDHWRSPGNSIGAAGAHAAWARYTALVAEYRAWLAQGAGH